MPFIYCTIHILFIIRNFFYIKGIGKNFLGSPPALPPPQMETTSNRLQLSFDVKGSFVRTLLCEDILDIYIALVNVQGMHYFV